MRGGLFLFKVEINSFAVPETLPGPWTDEGLIDTNS